MMRFLIRLIINAIALYVAVTVVPGIHWLGTGWTSFLWMGLIFGLVNALLSPLLKILTCPLIILTLGVFTLLINAALFALAGQIGTAFGIGFTVAGFWPAFWGALVVTVVSIVLSLIFHDERRHNH